MTRSSSCRLSPPQSRSAPLRDDMGAANSQCRHFNRPSSKLSIAYRKQITLYINILAYLAGCIPNHCTREEIFFNELPFSSYSPLHWTQNNGNLGKIISSKSYFNYRLSVSTAAVQHFCNLLHRVVTYFSTNTPFHSEAKSRPSGR